MDARYLHDFFKQLELFALPAPWQRLQNQALVRQCGSLTLEALGPLRASFSDAALIDSGILEEGPEGLQLSAGLRGQKWIQAHFEYNSRRLCGFSTALGLLTPAGPSQVSSLELAVRQESTPAGYGDIIFVSSPVDLAFLSSVGFVVRMQSTLVAHDPEGHARICRALGWLSPAELADRAAENYRNAKQSEPPTTESSHSPGVILLDWSPANQSLQGPADLGHVREHLCRVEYAFDRTLSNVGIWRGDQKTLDQLEFAAKLGSREDLHEILCNSAGQLVGLHAVEDTPVAPPDFHSAWAELHRQAATRDSAHFQAVASAFRAAYQRENASQASTVNFAANPQAAYLRLMHEDMFLTKYCECVRAFAVSPDGIPKASLKEFLALSEQIRRLDAPEPW